MILAYISKISVKVWQVDIKESNIISFNLKIFEIFLASFQIKDKLEKTKYFQKTFLLANFNIKMILELFFFIFNNANI